MKTFRRFVGYIWLAAFAACALAAISPEESITQRVVTLAYIGLLSAAVLVSLAYVIAWLVAAVTGKLDEERQNSAAESFVSGHDTSTALRTARLSWQMQLAAFPLAIVLNAVFRDSQIIGGIAFLISVVGGLTAAVSALVRARGSRAVVGHAIAGLTMSALLSGAVLYVILSFKQ